jgi:Sec-independent protein secretion pathway component TatC
LKSPRRGMCAAILTLEAVALGLSTPVMITVSDVSAGLAVLIGVGLCILCIVLSGMLRRPWAYAAGHLVQIAAVAIGFVVPMMFLVGGLFAVLWFTAYWLGTKIERERAAAYAAYEAEQAADA